MILHQDTAFISDLEDILAGCEERLKDKKLTAHLRHHFEQTATLYTAAIKVAAARLESQPKLSLSELCLKVLPGCEQLLDRCTIDIGPDPKLYNATYTTDKIILLRDFSYIYNKNTVVRDPDTGGLDVTDARFESYDCVFDYLDLYPQTAPDVTSYDPVAYFKGRIVQKYHLNHFAWTDKYVQGLTRDRPVEPDDEEQKSFL
jgi:hypothetical protein